MKGREFHGKAIFVAALFVASVFILGLKLLNPTSVQIVIEGQNATTARIPGFFTLEDVVIVAVASFILGVSATYLLYFVSIKPAGELVLEEKKKRWREIAKTLKNDEQKMYLAIIEAGGMIEQSKLPEKLGVSKASVSRTLDLLESKGLVERKRRGAGNVVLLK